MTVRIAFFPTGSKIWTGGSIYLKNLLIALKTFYASQAETVLLIPPEETEANYAAIVPYLDEVVVCEESEESQTAANSSFSPLQLLRSYRIDVVFGRGFSENFKVPTIGWIPDFQHLHLPEMFTPDKLRRRDEHHRSLAQRVTKLLLSSEDARSDFQQYMPELMDKTQVVHFVTAVPDSVYDLNLQEIYQRYHLPEKFIYLPNQFWRHKNHKVAFEAARILKERGQDIFLVCTGNPTDHRNPTYFAELCQLISEWDLRGTIAFLGLIPHAHVYALMRQSLCVLNPSRFEGWSTTVEEAKSLGKRLILSNLDVHLEQAPANGQYFDPDDAEALANLLADSWQTLSPGPDLAMEAAARAELPSRMQQFAQSFLQLVDDTIATHRDQMTRKIAHIVNPVKVNESSDLFTAQPITFETMEIARSLVQDSVNVRLYSAQYAEDLELLPSYIKATPNLERSILDIRNFESQRQLPLLRDILDRLYESSDAEYLIYSNVDIALTPHFYLTVDRMLSMGYDALVINRRTIPKKYKSLSQIPMMYTEIGEPHPGYDCFVFRRDAYPRYDLGQVCIGATWVGKMLLANLFCHAQKFRLIGDRHLTFHIGDDRPWRSQDNRDYRQFNKAEFLRVFETLRSKITDPEQLAYLESLVFRTPEKQQQYGTIPARSLPAPLPDRRPSPSLVKRSRSALQRVKRVFRR